MVNVMGKSSIGSSSKSKSSKKKKDVFGNEINEPFAQEQPTLQPQPQNQAPLQTQTQEQPQANYQEYNNLSNVPSSALNEAKNLPNMHDALGRATITPQEKQIESIQNLITAQERQRLANTPKPNISYGTPMTTEQLNKTYGGGFNDISQLNENVLNKIGGNVPTQPSTTIKDGEIISNEQAQTDLEQSINYGNKAPSNVPEGYTLNKRVITNAQGNEETQYFAVPSTEQKSIGGLLKGAFTGELMQKAVEEQGGNKLYATPVPIVPVSSLPAFISKVPTSTAIKTKMSSLMSGKGGGLIAGLLIGQGTSLLREFISGDKLDNELNALISQGEEINRGVQEGTIDIYEAQELLNELDSNLNRLQSNVHLNIRNNAVLQFRGGTDLEVKIVTAIDMTIPRMKSQIEQSFRDRQTKQNQERLALVQQYTRR